MNILFITHYHGMYGANQSMCRLIVELRADYNIRPIVLIPSKGEICDFLEENNIKYYVSHYYWWVNADKGIFQYFLNWRKQFRNRNRVKQINKLVSADKIELVYSNSITINIGAFISKKLNVPHIWHLRESLNSYQFKFSKGKLLSKLFLQNAADNSSISDYLLQSYTDLLPASKIKKIYNGIDFSRTDGICEKKNDCINLCMVGIICEQKNNMDAVKALHILKEKHKVENIKLHLVGGNKSDYLNLIKNYVANNNLQDEVVFHGHLNNIDTILTDMHIGLMCSRDEAFGRVTVEYMMHSMPVIASNSGANPEIIKEGVNGFLYNLYDVVELAKHIQYFVNNPSLINEYGERCQKFAIENFSSQKNTKEIYKLISSL